MFGREFSDATARYLLALPVPRSTIVAAWSVPAVAAGLAPGSHLGALGLVVAGLTGLGGVAATIAWWRGGDAGL